MFKENFHSPEKDFDQLLSALETHLKHRTKLYELDGIAADDQFGQEQAREEERRVISELIVFLKGQPELSETKNQELRFLGEEYLEMSEHPELAKEFSRLAGLKYYDLSPESYSNANDHLRAINEYNQERLNKRKKDN